MPIGHIFIYGGIGLDKKSGEVSSEDVRVQIEENKSASELIVHLISPGGDVFEGESIYNALKNSGKPITTHIEGTCASIATLVAAAGSKIIMNKTARFMIHNPKITGMQQAADSRDLRHVADQLDQIKTLLINVYDTKTSLGKEKLWELYDNETWLTADQAETMGFIDESVDAIKAVAKVDLTRFKMKTKESLWKKFENFLSSVKNSFTETTADGKVIVVESEDEDWTGKKVTYEDGSPVPAGQHQLVSGKVITVDDTGLISQVQQAAPADQKTTEDMDNKIKELESQLAQMKQDKETAEALAAQAKTEATQATAKAVKFENRVKAIEKEFLALKEEAGQTVGDRSEGSKGPVFKNAGQQQQDPMGEFALKFYKNNNVIRNEEA